MGDDFQTMSDMNTDDVEFEEPKKKVATDDDGLGTNDSDSDDDDDADDDTVDFNDTETM